MDTHRRFLLHGFTGAIWLVLWGFHLHAGGPGLRFIENRNQWQAGVDFGARVPGGRMFVRPGGFLYYLVDEERMEALHEQSHHAVSEATGALPDERINGQLVQMDWLGARNVAPAPYGRADTYYNYFVGSDPARWAPKAYGYDGVVYRAVYEGIDLTIYSVGQHLKYDFTVSAGADPSQIAGLYQGADEVTLDDNGNLYIRTGVGELIEKRPYAYQFINGIKTPVPCEFQLTRDNTLSFCFPEGYDTCEPLVIDPLLIFSTYSGSTADNWGSTATPGEHGMLYSSGVTEHEGVGSGTFPATPGAFQTSYGGLYDVAILKYDSTGSRLLYASYLGGNESESPHSLVMDANEELLVLGTTSSMNFPTTEGAYDRSYNGGNDVSHVVRYRNGSDIFVTRISKDGTRLLASTYLGGSGNDGLNIPFGPLTTNYGDDLRGDIITDGTGHIYISTVTPSPDFPAVNGFNTTFNGGQTDALLLKLSPDLSQLVWGAFLGGAGVDASHTLKIDSRGDLFVAGGTTSTNFPVTAGRYQTVRAGGADGWIAHVAGDGSVIKNATYTGTTAYDQVYFLDMNEDEEIYVYGQTAGNMPVTANVYHNPNSGQFVQKFTNDLSTLIFSTVFGSGRGIPDISPTAFLVNDCNNLYMTGWGGLVNINSNHWNSTTDGMPLTSDAFQSATSGSDFYFMVLTDDATEFLYGTYMGGRFSRTHVDGGTSRFDKSGIVYHAVCSGCAANNAIPNTSSSDFPTTPNAWSRVNRSDNCNNAAFKFDLSSLRAGLQTNSTRLDMPGLKHVCLPDSILFQNRCTGGELFEWDFGDGVRLVTPDTAAIPHQYPGPGQYLVKLKAIDPGTCLGKDSTATMVYIHEKNGVVQNDDDLCQGTPYQLWASGGVQYYWISEDSTFQSSEATPAVDPADTTRYIVRITEASGCVYYDSVQLNVIPGIDPDFEIVREGECTDRPSVHVRNLTENAGNAQMTFDFGDGTSSDLPETMHAYTDDDLYHITLTGVREFCVYRKEVEMPVYKLKVPNVITPGVPEGKNDTFVIQFGEGNVTPADFGIRVSLVVYNRWGDKVYGAADYTYDWAGEGLATGIYFYEVTVEGQATCKGWVHLIK